MVVFMRLASQRRLQCGSVYETGLTKEVVVW